MKIGLVLEGGGMRGLYTTGVLDHFMEREVRLDYVIGVSAGACNGLSYVSRQPGRNLRVNTQYIGDKRYLSLRNFMTTGSLFGMDFIFEELPYRLEPMDFDAFSQNPCEFVAGVTDVETGRPVYFPKLDSMEEESMVLRASSSLPIFSPKVSFRGREYLDGGTSDPIPFQKALEDGCDRLVVVLTRERGYVKSPERYRAVYRRIFRETPGMIQCLDRRHEVYNRELEELRELERRGIALVIAPKESLGLSRFEKDREKLMAAYRTGVRDAAQALETPWWKETGKLK